ncbi:MAG TPA: hypothetical protein VFQ53_34135 [Kofleriaceae bacterium]|nr:hypothetical protein [Kofleriaceae bacterium]
MRCPWICVSILALASACATAPESDHDEPADFVVDPDDGKGDGVAAVFDMNSVMTDALFTDGTAMTVDDVQAFLETTPYGTRSWLASYTIDGAPVSQAIVDAAQAYGIHPLVLLARMQTETSLVSKTVKPTQRLIDRALGCGCPDGSTCSSAEAGLGTQIECGARVLRQWYDGSVDGTGEWRRGVSKRTLDPRTVTPRTHATASLYAYTPWVLYGTGGTWLAWNITRKYVRDAEARGLVGPSL